METKIPVLLTERQIDYIMSHAHNRELNARDANRPVTQQFFIDIWEALFYAKREAAEESKVELNYERGAA
jgi:hypothetical protein